MVAKMKKKIISFIFTLEIDPVSFLRAARRGDIASCVEMLDAGVPSDTVDGLGSTALHHASLNNHTDIIDVILQKGVSVNECNNIGWTPLHFAIYGNSTDACRVLLQQGAKTTIKDKRGQTPVDYVPLWENEEAKLLLKQY